MSKVKQAAAELREWAMETGARLPYDAETIALEETMGVAFNLVTGKADTLATDGVQTLDDQAWLAGLEQACGGNVVITWAMRPEEYFAMVEKGEL